MEETNTPQVQQPAQRRSTRSRRSNARRTKQIPAMPNGAVIGTEHASSGTGTAAPAAGTQTKRRSARRASGRSQSSAGTVPWSSGTNISTAYGKLSGALTALYSAGVTRAQINEFVIAASGTR